VSQRQIRNLKTKVKEDAFMRPIFRP